MPYGPIGTPGNPGPAGVPVQSPGLPRMGQQQPGLAQPIGQQPGINFTGASQPQGGAAGSRTQAAAPATGSSASLLGNYPGLSTPPMNISGVIPAGGYQLPYQDSNLNAQSQNRSFEAAMQGPSVQQMLDNIRPSGSGIMRSGGDQQRIAGQLAQRSGAGANALAQTPFNQNMANANALLGQQSTNASNIVGQGNALEGINNAQGNYNLQSLISQLNRQYGGESAGVGLLNNVLGGLFGGTQSGLSGLLGGLA